MENQEIVKMFDEIDLSSQDPISDITLAVVNSITIGNDRSKTIALDFVLELYDEDIDDVNYQFPKRLFSVIKSILENSETISNLIELFREESILKDVDQFEADINACDNYSDEYVLYKKFQGTYNDKIKIVTTKFKNLVYTELHNADYRYVDQVRDDIELFEKVLAKKIYPLLSTFPSYSQTLNRNMADVADFMDKKLKKRNTADVRILPQMNSSYKFNSSSPTEVTRFVMTGIKMGIIYVDQVDDLTCDDLKRFTKEFITLVNGNDAAYKSDFVSRYRKYKSRFDISYKSVNSNNQLQSEEVRSYVTLFKDMNICFNNMMEQFLDESKK